MKTQQPAKSLNTEPPLSFQWRVHVEAVPRRDATGKHALDGSNSEGCCGNAIRHWQRSDLEAD